MAAALLAALRPTLFIAKALWERRHVSPINTISDIARQHGIGPHLGVDWSEWKKDNESSKVFPNLLQK